MQLLLNRLAGRGSWAAVSGIALGEFIYSLAVTVPAYFLFYFVYRRFGSGIREKGTAEQCNDR